MMRTPADLPAAQRQPLARHSPWPARLDVLQGLSGLLLVLFLIAHMGFVSSILISEQAFERVARFFEGEWLLGSPYPVIVSLAAAGVTFLVVFHAGLAMRKFPGGFRQYRDFIAHKQRLRHGDTSLWWLQVLTGFALFFLVTIHLYDMLSQPASIGPRLSAERVWTGNMWPIYLLLLFSAELHGGVGLYRLALKWGWGGGKEPFRARRRLRWLRHAFSAFFIGLGLVTLLAYIELGRNYAAQTGERAALVSVLARAGR